ncbi:MAG: Rv3235 family protein [Mycobacterium sp.]|uniref:Rv3235 family protein n=1 Tax=Mycobacterium sp. TaxID=1785 RepID=UPI003F97C109
MTVIPVVSPFGRGAFAVTPVVDYEPPTQDVPRNVPQCGPSSHATLRRRSARGPHRPHLAQRSRPPQTPAAEVTSVTSAPMRQAAIFADAALRRVLEVIDRRRPAAQLRPMLASSLVDSVLSIGRSAAGPASGRPPGQEGAAVLRRMRLQPAGHGDPETAAEVYGCYSRGDRFHAIACRVEQVRDGARTRWLVVALHIG